MNPTATRQPPSPPRRQETTTRPGSALAGGHEAWAASGSLWTPRQGALGLAARTVGALALAGLLALPGTLRPGPAAAQAPFAVMGQIVNRTAGASVPTGLPVRVVAFTDAGETSSWAGTSQEDGRYRVDGLTRMPGATYLVGVEHQGVSYVERFEPTDQDSVEAPPLPIYESVAEDPGLRFERSALIVSQVDSQQQTVTMLEVHSVVNPTDRTFRPGPDGAGGPSGLLVFALPMHAFGLTPQLGLSPGGLVQIDRGFASLEPIRPGKTEIAFTYQFPYSESSYLFRRTVRYPVDSVRVLAPQPGPSLSAAEFTTTQVVSIGDRQYQELVSGALAPGAVITLTLDGLPTRPTLPDPLPPAAVGLAGVATGLAAVALAWRQGQRRRPLPLTQEELLDRLVALEVERATGRMAAAAYEAARQELLARGVRWSERA